MPARPSPADIRRGDIAEYLSHLAEQGNSGNTRARKLAAIREYFRFLEGEGLVSSNPTLGVATPKKERGSRTALRSDDYTRLLSLAGANPHDYATLQRWTPYRECLGVGRYERRDGAELLHEAQEVGLRPVLDQLAVHEAVERHSLDLDHLSVSLTALSWPLPMNSAPRRSSAGTKPLTKTATSVHPHILQSVLPSARQNPGSPNLHVVREKRSNKSCSPTPPVPAG